MGWLSYLFAFRGRIGRARFWLYVAIAVPLLIFLLLVFWAYAFSIPGAYENGGPTPFPSRLPGIAGAVLFFTVLACVLIAGLAVTVKRLHDRNKAWWWLSVFVLAPDCLSGLAQVLRESHAPVNGDELLFLRYAALAFAAWGVVELGVLRGTRGDNRFGADPRERSPG